MTNVELLKEIGSRLIPKWEVDNHHIWCPLTMTKEDGHVVRGVTWDKLDNVDMMYYIQQMIKHSNHIREANEDLDAEIIDMPLYTYTREHITTLKIKRTNNENKG